MKEIVTIEFQNRAQLMSGNGQPLREALLRLAVKYCEDYATDVLILIEAIEAAAYGDYNKFTIPVGFRQYGVDWLTMSDWKDLSSIQRNKYRYVARIIYDTGTMTLMGEVGGV